MERPTIDNTAAVFQAGTTVQTYLSQAVAMLEKTFGDGYAQDNPALVAELVRSQTLDFNNCALTAALYKLVNSHDEIGAVLATAADTLGDAINPPPQKRQYINP